MRPEGVCPARALLLDTGAPGQISWKEVFVKHLLIDAASAKHIDRKARVWTITRGADGGLEESLDLDHLLKLNPGRGIDEIVDALLGVLAERDVAETRIW